MSVELGRRLLASELVTRENVRDALHISELQSISFPRALVECGIVTEAALDDEIARLAGPGLRYVQGSIELVAKLPRAMPRRLSALPTRIDPATGIIDVAAADPFDPHVESEMSFHLNARVRVLRASIGAVEEAIRRIEVAAAAAREEPPQRVRRLTPALPYGAPESIPPPAASTPIPLVKRASPDSISAVTSDDLSIEDTYTDDSDSLSRTAAWGSLPQDKPVRSLSRTIDIEEDPFASADESESLGRTAAWGSLRAASVPALDVPEDDLDQDESASLGRTAGWASPGHAIAMPMSAPAKSLSRTLGFEEEAPRVSFPSTAPPGLESIPPPLGFAPPELSAWKGLASPRPPKEAAAYAESLTSNDILTAVNVPDVNVPDVDVETTYVSEPEDVPAPITQASVPLPVASVAASATSFEESFEDEPQRMTLTEFPPPTSMVDVKTQIAELATANSRDEIIELVFRSMALFARRSALFAVKRDGYHGWMCNDAFGTADALRQVVVPNDQPSVMATATATSIYLGPIPRTPAHDKLYAVMGSASRDVAVASVRVGGKVAAVLVADELRDTLSGTRRMDELARAMGEALTRLVKTRG